MTLRSDWPGLGDAFDSFDRHRTPNADVMADNNGAAPTRQAPTLIVPVSALDGSTDRGNQSVAPGTPGGLAITPIHPAPDVFGQADEVAYISGVSADGTLPLYAFAAWNNDTPATYTGGTTASHKWGASTAGTPGGTISYSFDAASNWSPTEKSFLAAGLSMWSDVANIQFSETTSASAQIVFTRGSDGQAHTDFSYSILAGSGKTGGSILYQMTHSTVSIDTTGNGFGPILNFTTAGGYPIQTLLHEEGHAIGLSHAGPYDGSVNEATQQFSPYDTRLWSIMSYIEPGATNAAYYNQYPVTGTKWGFATDGYANDPTGLMPLDVLAAQQLYGAATATPLSGGQVFGFHSNVAGPSGMFFDFTQNTNPILTLWDAGTNNTLDLSGWSAASTVNLNPGTFSSANGMVNNLAIGFGTAIDTLVGGSGADTVTGNNDGDTFTGNGGNDSFTGGTGTDTAVYSGDFADYTIASLGNAGFSVTDNRAGSPDGTDTLNQVEQAKFADGIHTLAPGGSAPQLGGGGNTVVYAEQGANVAIDSALTLTEAGSTQITGATVTISSGYVAGDSLMFARLGEISGSYNADRHVLTLTGQDNLDDYQAALRSVRFLSNSDNPTAGGTSASRTISFGVVNGAQSSNAITSTVAVKAVDDAPALGGSGTRVAYTEQAAGVAINGALTLGDPDNTTLTGATVTIAGGYLAGDTLGFVNQAGITGVYSAATHVLALSGSASLAAYQTALRSITFSSTSDNPSNYGGIPTRAINFVASDGTLASAAATMYVSITGVNDAPQIGGTGNTAHYTEQSAAAILDSGLVLSDPDSLTLAGATVTISSGFVVGDALNFRNQNGITGSYDARSHALTLTGSASIAAYQTALRSVTFSSPSDNPTNLGANPTRTITWGTDDGQTVNHASRAVTSSLAVTAVDDRPVLHNDAFATTESTVIGAGLNVFANNGSGADSDPDGPALSVHSVNGFLVTPGLQLKLASGALLTMSPDGTFSYNPNHAFDTLAAPGSGASDTTATDTFTYTVGGVSATATVTITGVDSNDILTGTRGNDTFDGGAGSDRLIFNGSEYDYKETFNPRAGTFTISGPEGTDTARNVELYQFRDGIYQFDTGSHPWSALGLLTDSQGSLIKQNIINDNGERWINQYDTTNAGNWLWQSSKFDANLKLLQTVTTYDNGAHALRMYEPDGSSWAVSFDAKWSITSFTSNFDRAQFDQAQWFKTPYDANQGAAVGDGLTTGNNIDVLYGFAGNDILSSGGGNDYLNGGLGNDTLTGGGGADHFFFQKGDGLDTITDFTPGSDQIELQGYTVPSFARLQALMSQHGADTVITFDAQDIITLHNVTVAQLHSGDFILS